MVPDWDKIDPSEWNTHQKRAAETNGWDTPGNRESAKGLIATSLGIIALSKEKYFTAAALLAYGRIKDLTDGKRAAETGTKSPLGEVVDASLDKGLITAIIPVLRSKNIINDLELACLAAQHGTSTVMTGITKKKGNEIHPTQSGKLSTGVEWLAIGTGVIGKGIEKAGFERTADIVNGIEKVTMTVGLALGGIATAGYVKDALFSQPAVPPESAQIAE